MILTKEKGKRMWGNWFNGGNTNGGSGGSGGSGGGGGSTEWAANAGHADEADHATAADLADEAKALTSDSTDWLKIARKDIAQTIAEAWTFAKGFTSTLVSKFKAGIKIGASDQYQIDANGDATLRDIGGRAINASTTIQATGNITSNGAMQAYGNITSANGNMQAVQMLSDVFKTLGFTAGMLGKGFGVSVDQIGRASLQTDDLLVLGQMIVHMLNIREVTYIGGIYYLSPAASTVHKVQNLYSSTPSDTRTWSTEGTGTPCGYRLLWKADDGTIGTMNYWQQGDQAFCQTFNITEPGDYTDFQNQYYHRLVARVGTVTIDGQDYHYADLAATATCYLYDGDGNPIQNAGGGTQFVGYVGTSNTAPAENDKVVMRGSQRDTTRMGAIIISTEGEASIGIYDGIDYFDVLSTYEIHYFSKSAVRMSASYITWKTTGGNETQANFMATTKNAFLGINGCGIDFTNESVAVKGGKFKMQDENGVDTFVLNENGDLESKGSASFEGTIRARNIFKTLAVSGGSNSNVTDRCEVVTMMNADTNVTWVYVLNDIPASTYGHAFSAGDMLTGQEINALVDSNSRFCWKDDTTNFRIFTGPADEVILVNKVSWMYVGYTFIPRCQDFPGKEITIRNYTSNSADAEIRQVDLAQNVFAAGAYVSSPSDDYNDIGYGSNLDYKASVPQGDVITLYSTGSVWLILKKLN